MSGAGRTGWEAGPDKVPGVARLDPPQILRPVLTHREVTGRWDSPGPQGWALCGRLGLRPVCILLRSSGPSCWLPTSASPPAPALGMVGRGLLWRAWAPSLPTPPHLGPPCPFLSGKSGRGHRVPNLVPHCFLSPAVPRTRGPSLLGMEVPCAVGSHPTGAGLTPAFCSLPAP